jgi:hypothetical protein
MTSFLLRHMLFFYMDNAASKVKGRLLSLGEHAISETHPPASTRAKCVRQYMFGMAVHEYLRWRTLSAKCWS